MKLYYYLILCLLLGCNNEKKETSTTPSVITKVDTSLSYEILMSKLRRSHDNYGEYRSFLLGKKALQIADSTAFINDYEIRLYLFRSFQGAFCYRYTLRDNEWKGERILKRDHSARSPERKSISPQEGWRQFIHNALNNGLLDMPTRAEMDQEINKLIGLYPTHGFMIMDGKSVAIEVISKDYYDLQLYDNRLALADDFPEAIVLKKINKLINSLFIPEK